MKVGIVGKGGVGKTTVSALIAQGYVARSVRVLAVELEPVRDEIEQLIGFLEGSLV